MSAGLVGGDVEQLQRLGDDLKSKQGNIDEIINAVRNAVGTTVWQGPARDAFENEWRTSFEPALKRMNEAFDAAGNQCKARATALHDAMVRI